MSEEQKLHKTELFVQSLPKDSNSEELTTFFSDLAPVKHAMVVMQPGTNESKGFGFVSFSNADDAKMALDQAKKTKFRDGTNLRVSFAKPRERRGQKDKPQEEKAPVEKRRPRLIIRNMPWSVRDKDALAKIFAKYGKVVDAFIPRKDNGKMSGFAFVTMRKKSHALTAIEGSKDLKIGGRAVAVDWAVEKEKWLNRKEDGEEESESESESESEEEDDDDEDEDEDEEDNDEDEDEEEEEEEDDKKPAKAKVRGASNNCSIFVRNIPYDSTGETLQEHFGQFGKVRYALPVMDKLTGQPKGTAFVAFQHEETCNDCVNNAPSGGASSLLVADDVDPRYVLEGRILSIAKAVERETANKLADASAKKRDELLGKGPQITDKRRTFLLNEGRITPESKLASLISKSELEIRENSFKERKKQLEKNPSLHLSLTRLAIRNLPRSMREASLKQLCRTAVVEFQKEVKEEKRQPLSQEEKLRSSYAAQENSKKKSKHGVIRQVKIIQEMKDSGEYGRSRGYGFVEFRDHRSALMGLRWLNAHKVTNDELKAGMSEEELETFEPDTKGRRLVVEFAIENASVLKKRQERQQKNEAISKRKREEQDDAKQQKVQDEREQKRARFNDPKGKEQLIIAKKRREKKGKKGKN